MVEIVANLGNIPQEVYSTVLILLPSIFSNINIFKKRMRIRDIPAVWNSAGKTLATDADYETLIDLPARRAVRHLNTLGIITDYSSANIEDAEAGTGAIIRFQDYSLSEDNLKVAKELALSNVKGNILIDVPITPDDDVVKVEKKMLAVAKKFKNQK